MTRNYELITKFLKQDPFDHILGDRGDYDYATAHRLVGKKRSADMYHFLTTNLKGYLGINLEAKVARAFVVVMDNETTGFRDTREAGFPQTEAGWSYLYGYCHLNYNKGYRNQPVTLKTITPESDCIRFRGTFWNQLTWRANFEMSGDEAYRWWRKTTATKDPILLSIRDKWDKLSTMPNVILDCISRDPYMNMLVFIIYASDKNGKHYSTWTPLDHMNNLTDLNHVAFFKLIGYDNDPKPERFAHVISLDGMIKKFDTFTLVNKSNKKQENEQKEAQSRTRSSYSTRFSFARRIRS